MTPPHAGKPAAPDCRWLRLKVNSKGGDPRARWPARPTRSLASSPGLPRQISSRRSGLMDHTTSSPSPPASRASGAHGQHATSGKAGGGGASPDHVGHAAGRLGGCVGLGCWARISWLETAAKAAAAQSAGTGRRSCWGAWPGTSRRTSSGSACAAWWPCGVETSPRPSAPWSRSRPRRPRPRGGTGRGNVPGSSAAPERRRSNSRSAWRWIQPRSRPGSTSSRRSEFSAAARSRNASSGPCPNNPAAGWKRPRAPGPGRAVDSPRGPEQDHRRGRHPQTLPGRRPLRLPGPTRPGLLPAEPGRGRGGPGTPLVLDPGAPRRPPRQRGICGLPPGCGRDSERRSARWTGHRAPRPGALATPPSGNRRPGIRQTPRPRCARPSRATREIRHRDTGWVRPSGAQGNSTRRRACSHGTGRPSGCDSLRLIPDRPTDLAPLLECAGSLPHGSRPGSDRLEPTRPPARSGEPRGEGRDRRARDHPMRRVDQAGSGTPRRGRASLPGAVHRARLLVPGSRQAGVGRPRSRANLGISGRRARPGTRPA